VYSHSPQRYLIFLFHSNTHLRSTKILPNHAVVIVLMGLETGPIVQLHHPDALFFVLKTSAKKTLTLGGMTKAKTSFESSSVFYSIERKNWKTVKSRSQKKFETSYCMQNAVFWNVTPCSSYRSRRLGETYRLQLSCKLLLTLFPAR
jgi:hypothetical protein